MFPGVDVLEIFRLEREGYAAQLAGSAQHIPQQGNNAICPNCGSDNVVEYVKPPVLFVCHTCNASWGKQP
jgi:transposase-like protein